MSREAVLKDIASKLPGPPNARLRRLWMLCVAIGVIAFAYHIAPPFVLPENTTDAFAFHDDTYLMRAISSADYRKHMTTRSPRWGTVGLPAKAFRNLVKPFTAHLRLPALAS